MKVGDFFFDFLFFLRCLVLRHFCFDLVGEAEGSGGGVAWLFDISFMVWVLCGLSRSEFCSRNVITSCLVGLLSCYRCLESR